MTHLLSDILANKWEEPPEIKIIKDYALLHFQAEVGVSVQNKQININVSGAALAATLRMHIHEIQQAIGSDKRLVIRIGS